MTKKNDFTEDFTAYMKTSVDLTHLLTFLPWQFKMAKSTVKQSIEILEKEGAPKNCFGPMTGSSIINIFHDGAWVTRAPGGKRITVGNDVDRMATEVEGRFSASVLGALHEAWEEYVKNLYPKMLRHLKDEIPIPNRERFHDKHTDWRSKHRTAEYFKEYAAWACFGDVKEPLKVFRKELDWSLVKMPYWLADNNCVIEWMEVPRMLAFCRHCIVHNNGRVFEKSLKRYSPPQRHVIKSLMGKSMLGDDQRLLPPVKNADRFIEAMLSLAYGIYVLISNRCDLEVEFTPWKAKSAKV